MTAWEEDGPERRAAVAQDIAERLARGHICFVARDGSRIVHCTWVAFGWQETFAGRYVVTPHETAYCGGSYTAKDRRGLAIHTEVNWAVLCYLRERGYTRALAYIECDNPSSRRHTT